jgi:catechol 2,3-dioxygenase-like lactoylglutathione lyase family enzyme
MRTTLLTRREALATLTAGALATRTALSADAPFRFGALDHLALAVDDTEKSVHFYTRVFGNTVLKEKTNPRHYVKLGPNYVAMAPPGQGQASQAINHFCPGIVNFDLAATKRALDQMGIQYREATGVGLFVPDPDGTLVQLWTESSWSHLGETAAPAAATLRFTIAWWRTWRNCQASRRRAQLRVCPGAAQATTRETSRSAWRLAQAWRAGRCPEASQRRRHSSGCHSSDDRRVGKRRAQPGESRTPRPCGFSTGCNVGSSPRVFLFWNRIPS